MADAITIAAAARDRAGKGAARAARREGRLPAVIYGDKKPPVGITVDELEFFRLFKDPSFYTHLYSVEIDGKPQTVLARDVQLDPVLDFPIHVDFLRVSARTRTNVNVPVQFVNEEESPGLERGGVLNIVRHEVEVSSRADAIPDAITIDLTGYDVGDSIHISSITLPDGVEPTITDRDFTIATIAAPTVVKDEAAEEEAEAAEAEAAEEETGEAESGEESGGESGEDEAKSEE
ncbi:MAG: 50S ribosomal protein L25/general stress protein Ctc [Azospirillaceae bacterium]